METAPYFDEIAFGPASGAAHWVTTSDGLRIRVGHWPNASARATVLIFPGRTEYVEKYGRVAASLAERGFAALAIDWRGQGISARLQEDRSVGHVDHFTDYQKDVEAVVTHARALGLPEPFYLIGHSMGGCIGLRALIEGLPVKAAAFTGPMWGIAMSAALRPIAWGLSSVSKPLKFSHIFAPGQVAETYVRRVAFEINTLTSDRETFDLLNHQLESHPDLALGGPSLHWLHEALTEMFELHGMASPDVPCHTFVGSEEAIVDPTRIHDRMGRWPGGRLDVIKGARHELMMEQPQMRREIFDAMAALFDRHR